MTNPRSDAVQVLFTQRTSYLEFFYLDAFYPLWVVQRLSLVAFWVVAAYCSTLIFDSAAYDPEYLMRV